MGVAPLERRVQTRSPQLLVDERVLVPIDQSMDARRLGNDLPHLHARVERGIGVLKNHLRLQLVRNPLAASHRPQRLPEVPDLAAAGLADSGEESRECGLAAPGLTDETHDLALSNGQIDAIHGRDRRGRLCDAEARGETSQRGSPRTEHLRDSHSFHEGNVRARSGNVGLHHASMSGR